MKRLIILAAMVMAFVVKETSAQTAPPPPVWTGNFGAGLALTTGNTDTKNINLSLGVVRDPKKRSVVRLNGLYLRGSKEGDLIVNQTAYSG